MPSGSSQLHATQSYYKHASGLVKIRSVLSERLEKGGQKVLDAGSGDGKIGLELAKLGNQVTCFDVNAEGLGEAKKAGLDVVTGDLESEWPFAGESFDAVLLLDVLEHLVNPLEALKEAKKVLKKDGEIYIAFPNHFDLRQRLETLFGKGQVHWSHKKYKQPSWIYGHVRFFTLDDLLAMISEAGLGVEMLQLNFMGGGIIPRRFTPKWLRVWLTKTFPNLFSGKFILRVVKAAQLKQQKHELVILSVTPFGV